MSDEFMDALDEETAAGEAATHLTQNVADNKHCRVCHDDGWVPLEMVVLGLGGVEYSVYVAPCTLCEIGVGIANCMRTGIDYRYGSGKPREQPWRAMEVWTDYSHSLTDSGICYVCAPRGITFDEYLGTERGAEDPAAHQLQAYMVEQRARRGRRLGGEDTPQPLSPAAAAAGRRDPPSPARASGFAGRFASLAGDSVGSSPNERSEE